jgi:hypothetical protein
MNESRIARIGLPTAPPRPGLDAPPGPAPASYRGLAVLVLAAAAGVALVLVATALFIQMVR